MTYGPGHASGTAGALVPGTLARYLPFGDWRAQPSADLTDIGFTGHKSNNVGSNDIGLIYMNARYYVPGVNRFASADSIVPNPVNPQSLNRYSYGLNSPLRFTDPAGHRECEFDDYCGPIPQSPSPPLPSGIVNRPVSNRILQRYDVTTPEFMIPVHTDLSNPYNPVLYDYEIAAFSLYQEQSGLHPANSIYRNLDDHREFFAKYGIMDAIALVQAMVNRQANDDRYDDIFHQLIQGDEFQNQFAYSDAEINTESEIYEDFLLIAYIVVELNGIPDLIGGRDFYNHRDLTSYRNNEVIWPSGEGCCLDRAAFGFDSGTKDLVLTDRSVDYALQVSTIH
jgi:RHS repeat-associated protein